MILSCVLINVDKLVLYKHISIFKKYIVIYLKIFILSKDVCLYSSHTAPISSFIAISPLKPLRKKITILRSPHIFSKAKERFLRTLYRYNLNLDLSHTLFHNNLFKFIFLKFILFFLNYCSIGSFLKIRYNSNSCYKFI